jgi:hypothetical protein
LKLTRCHFGCGILDPIIQKLPKLAHLSIEPTYNTGEKPFTSDSLILLANSCPLLLTLELIGCDLIDDTSLSFLAEKCKLLTLLNLRDCGNLTDISFIKIARGCNLLKEVYFPRTAITDKTLLSLKDIINPQIQWRKVELWECNEISDYGLCALIESCKQLEHLDVDRCDAITDSSILHLIKHCPELKILHTNGCSSVTVFSLCEVIAECPNCTQLFATADLFPEDNTLLLKAVKQAKARRLQIMCGADDGDTPRLELNSTNR